jgi:predicted NAD/FAD-dependent oxidoreductase
MDFGMSIKQQSSKVSARAPGAGDAGILIVGAGLTGLTAAAHLAAGGHQVTVLDKGRSVGGRLATRRVGNGLADHGAQFFTARSPLFQAMVAEWQATGLAQVWGHGWSDGSLDARPGDGHPRYMIRGGMNALAKALAGKLPSALVTMRTGVKVVALATMENGWLVKTDAGEQLGASALLLTAPVAQSLALLAAGNVLLEEEDRTTLERIDYAPCLCGMVTVEGELRLPPPGALQLPAAPISWIADNQRKGLSPHATVVTLHANPEWSRTHYDAGDAHCIAAFGAALAPWLGPGARLQGWEVKRWRYALPTVLHHAPFLCRRCLWQRPHRRSGVVGAGSGGEDERDSSGING